MDDSKEWIQDAESEIDTAIYLLEGRKLKQSAFHAQQAVEKALKAIQIQKLKRFERSHDLVSLAQSIDAPEEIINTCISLNPTYTSTRYLDRKKVYSEPETKTILQQSKKVFKWAQEQIK